MTKRCPQTISVAAIAFFTIALLAVSVFPTGLCNAAQVANNNGYALLIEQTPADAGFITPEPGVHEQDINSTFALRAVPKPGFKFLYWLGDVNEMSESETSVQLDSPKIVVAVFSPTDNVGGGAESGLTLSRGYTTLRNSRVSLRSSAGVRGATPRDPVRWSYPQRSYNTEEIVPEPASLLILGMGSLIVIKSRKKKNEI